ncbi:restriction endonuclease subunit S [Pseudomonas sp.]|uniref:restriction endonuclease subunit S n=1 Tax=Pseudomonas sp. TaxID=306 RepID=UPI00273566D9|nr:restriction endonuclease subunit S [Pseudomonas sp.]MDP3815888.1 restriction endonuclease subunit S [Pseudomonas sp.]
MTALLTDNLPLLAGAPNGIKKLRELILELAVRGKLVPQDSNDGQASDWLGRIEIEKARLLEAGLLKKTKKVTDVELDFGIAKVPSSWGWVTLSDITLGMDSGWSPACESNSSPNNDVWGVLKTTAVQVMQFLQEENKELPAHLEPRSDAEVKAGDILFTRAGPTNRVGISCLVESTRPRLMISDKIIRFHPIEAGTYGRYIALCLNAGSTARYLEIAKSGMAASQVNISQEKLKLAPIPLAPLPEQHRIVAKVDELMALCDRLEAQQADAASAHVQLVQALLDSLIQEASDTADLTAKDGGNAENAGAIFGLASWQRLAEHFHTLFTTEPSIDALKQALLQLAVMGKLVPQDPNDEPASELLKRIAEEKARLVAEGKLKKQKPLAEIAEVEKSFELPENWEWVRLEEIAQVGTGATPLRTNLKYFEPATINWVTSGETSQDHIHETEQKVSPLALTETNLTVYPPHTLVIAMYGQGKTRGQISELLIDACTNQACAAIQLFDQGESHRRYVKYFFVKSYDDIRLLAAGGAQPNLNLGKIKETVLPLPPLAEQHRIVAKVDQLMALCNQLKARLSQARQLNEQLASTLVEQAVA